MVQWRVHMLQPRPSTTKNRKRYPKSVSPSSQLWIQTEIYIMLVTQLCLTFWEIMGCSFQAPLSMVFSREEYWNRLLFPSPRDPPDSRVKPRSIKLQADSLLSKPASKPLISRAQFNIPWQHIDYLIDIHKFHSVIPWYIRVHLGFKVIWQFPGGPVVRTLNFHWELRSQKTHRATKKKRFKVTWVLDSPAGPRVRMWIGA